MAILLPSLSSCTGRMTSGERRFGTRLDALLEDDYLCWYDAPIGPKSRHPDFIVLHPRRGILVLEVKDWKLDSIRRIDRHGVDLLTPQGMKTVANPMEQARQYIHGIVKLLESDPQLLHPAGHRFRGKLIAPFGYGVVLANITRKQFESTDLGEVIPAQRVICRDEMTSSSEAEEFQKRLWDMFTVPVREPLSLPQINRIRARLYPEVVIPQAPLFDSESPGEASAADPLPDVVKVMDLQQERLARSLGAGHRVIHGVAGAGKTLILVNRCMHLARTTPRPLLVLCYNRSLAERLEHLLRSRGLDERVEVWNFHRWCHAQLRTYHEPLPPDGPDRFDALVQRTKAAVDAGRIPSAQYGAVLIDEGHDFQPDWLELAVSMVDPDTQSLLVLYDDAQSIYGRDRPRFTFSSVGIQARGRTTILRLNYRNTEQILKLAAGFARELLTEQEAEEDGIPLVMPESAGRRGPAPALLEAPSLSAEVTQLVDSIRLCQSRGRSWSEIAVVYRLKFVGERVEQALRRAGIPTRRVGSRQGHGDRNSVSLVTMHSSKGLEFPVVFVCGLGYMPARGQDEKDEARLLYVAITRAMDEVVISGQPGAPFMNRLREAMPTAA